jgi:hypothetical protein
MSKPSGNWEDDGDRADLARTVRSVKKPGPNLSTIGKFRQIVAEKQANRINGVFVDLFTASTVIQVHNALNSENKVKLEALPARKMAMVCLKLANMT